MLNSTGQGEDWLRACLTRSLVGTNKTVSLLSASMPWGWWSDFEARFAGTFDAVLDDMTVQYLNYDWQMADQIRDSMRTELVVQLESAGLDITYAYAHMYTYNFQIQSSVVLSAPDSGSDGGSDDDEDSLMMGYSPTIVYIVLVVVGLYLSCAGAMCCYRVTTSETDQPGQPGQPYIHPTLFAPSTDPCSCDTTTCTQTTLRRSQEWSPRRDWPQQQRWTASRIHKSNRCIDEF